MYRVLVLCCFGRSHRPRGQRCGFAAASLLGLRVRIHPGAWCLSLVSVVCCQVGLITRPAESTVRACVSLSVINKTVTSTRKMSRQKEVTNIYIYVFYY